MRKIIILSAATLVLSSCGIYNKYKPVSEVPEGLYGSESVAAADTANFGNLSWQEVFTDPSLQNLIDSALVRNTDMQTAHLRVKEAEATLLTSKLSYLPSLFLAHFDFLFNLPIMRRGTLYGTETFLQPLESNEQSRHNKEQCQRTDSHTADHSRTQ